MPQKNLKKKIVSSKTSSAKKPAKSLKSNVRAAVKSKPVVKTQTTKTKTSAKTATKATVKPAIKMATAPVAVKKEALKFVAAKPAIDKKAVGTQKSLYKVGNYVVYPTHGVGKIMAEETQMIGEIELRMLVISFEKDKMTLRVPLSRASAAGLRPVSTTEQMKKVFGTLKSRARTSRGMWSRRAQEYETKINSGNIHFIAEVVRDLHQNVDQSERSYSERMIYESALARLVGELAACEGTDYKTATDKLMKFLRAKVAAAAEALKEAA